MVLASKPPYFDSREPNTTGFWARVGDRIAVALARCGWSPRSLLLAASSGLFTLKADGLSTEDTYTKEFDSIKGQKLLRRARPPGQPQHRADRDQHRCSWMRWSPRWRTSTASASHDPGGDLRQPFLLRGHRR